MILTIFLLKYIHSYDGVDRMNGDRGRCQIQEKNVSPPRIRASREARRIRERRPRETNERKQRLLF